MVIWSEFRMEQDRDDNHREDAHHFKKTIDDVILKVTYESYDSIF